MVRLNTRAPLSTSKIDQRLPPWTLMGRTLMGWTLMGWTLMAIVLLAGCSSAPPGPTQPTPRTAPEVPRLDSSSPAQPPGPEQALTLALHDQADAARIRGDHERAIATLERAIRIDPDAPELWLLLSRVNLDAGDAAAAEQLARKALQLVGGRPHLEQQAWTLIDAAERQATEDKAARSRE